MRTRSRRGLSGLVTSAGRRAFVFFLHERESIAIRTARSVYAFTLSMMHVYALQIDHATGVVFGETAVVGDNCTFLHGVTLGGTGKSRGDRHPKLGCGILVGAGSMILGNIRVGDGCKVSFW